MTRLQSLWLPARVTGPTDEEIAGCIATLVRRLVELRWSVRDEGYEAEITPSDIAVVVSHRAEATAVRTRLPGGFEDVNVKTSDAIQGEERRIVIAQHPLSGREAMGAWDLEAGRLNVMLSRHRIGCFLFGREGIEHALDRYSPSGERVIGLDEDHEHEGWLANRRLLDRLRSERRLRYLGTAA